MAVTIGPILVNTNVYSVLTYIPYHSIAYSENYIIKHLVFSAQLTPHLNTDQNQIEIYIIYTETLAETNNNKNPKNMRTHLAQGSSPASENLWSQPVNCGLQAGFDCRPRPCVKTQKSSQMQTKQTI